MPNVVTSYKARLPLALCNSQLWRCDPQCGCFGVSCRWHQCTMQFLVCFWLLQLQNLFKTGTKHAVKACGIFYLHAVLQSITTKKLGKQSLRMWENHQPRFILVLNNVIFSTVVPLQSVIDTRNTQILPHQKEQSKHVIIISLISVSEPHDLFTLKNTMSHNSCSECWIHVSESCMLCAFVWKLLQS